MTTTIVLPTVGESGSTWPGKINTAITVVRDAADAAAMQDAVSLATFGVLPAASAAANVAGFAAAAASTSTSFFLPAGTYNVQLTEGGTLMSFVGRSNIRIVGDNATLNDTTAYTNNGAFTSMVWFNACTNVSVTGINYVGPTIASPTVDLGYKGAIYARISDGTNGARIEATITNARYGVQSGDYDTVSRGNCKNLTVKLRTTMCGYPIATYLADGLRIDIDADTVHRVAYIAGGDDVRGIVKWKDQYIGDTCLLLTDAKTGTGTSRGCSNVDMVSIDKGSTVFQASSMCAGIVMSRVDPGTVYRNIQVKVHVVGTDTLSTKVGGFRILSGASVLDPTTYPWNWASTIVFDNVKISGIVDKSASTLVGCSSGDLSIITFDTDATHAATVRNLFVDDLTILKSTAAHGGNYLSAPGLTSPARIRNLLAAGQDLNIFTNLTVPTVLENCTVANVRISTATNSLLGGSRVTIGAGTTYTALIDDTTTKNVDAVSRRFIATIPPWSGTWAVGDEVKNKAPAVGSPVGWVCTVAGSPGTWVSLGLLGASAGIVATKTANYTVLGTDQTIIANGTTISITLPTPVGAAVTGRTYTIKNINSTSATVATAAGLIDGAATAVLAQWANLTVISDGANWLSI